MAAGFIWTNLKFREHANRIAGEYCREAEVQFLDGSVSFGTFGIVRNRNWFRLRRVYVFEYTRQGVTRHHAAIVFIGREFTNLLLIEP